MCLNNFNSRQVLLASTIFENGLKIFLMATDWPVLWSKAELQPDEECNDSISLLRVKASSEWETLRNAS
jgi:hypothetical protein